MVALVAVLLAVLAALERLALEYDKLRPPLEKKREEQRRREPQAAGEFQLGSREILTSTVRRRVPRPR
jgi:hypothetical protein